MQHNARVFLVFDRPEGHPGSHLEPLTHLDVLRVRLRLGQVREQVRDGGVAEILDGDGHRGAVQVLCKGTIPVLIQAGKEANEDTHRQRGPVREDQWRATGALGLAG